MNRFISACIVAAMTVCQYAQARETTDDNFVTVISYNVHNGVGLDNKSDYDRIGRTISRHNPDIVAIQEVDSATMRSNGSYVLAEIGRATGLCPTFAPAIDFQGGKYGIGILNRHEPLSVRRIPLPGREEARVLLIAEFPQYTVGCTHLSLTEADAMTAAHIILRETADTAKPLIIAGDFNLQPDSEPMELLRSRFSSVLPADMPTFPADQPAITIDYIMTDNRSSLTIEEQPYVADADELASDHRPIVARLRLPSAGQ